ncbi:MFS transporter [Prosthecobacter fusiformis]|uniref:MFS transporter n=1 Tax=Prosthecobacter fusiformis TaxID=48464 RepID=A0A4R7RMZ1_9BACT|nr:MFS transporter [Prosthecobacter fusiformis]TDU66095.1 MFS transporter [Prosthecobacter fusiformis]
MPAPKLTSTQWLICFIASIGFAFDIYELLMLPLIVGPALQELIGAAPGTPEFNSWVGKLFYIPAIAGGVFGLLGGYLTDRLGRRRVLTWSILIYAFSAFAAGYSTSVEMLLFFRCLVFIGVCVEFVAAVAWLAELFPDPKQREKVLGYTQAFSSIGGLLVAVANGLCIKYSLNFPAIHFPDFLSGMFGGGVVTDEHAAWRYTLMSGLIPAIPLIIIRPFLPESPAWAQKKAAGTLKRPSLGELFTPELRRTTLVTTAMFAMAYGAAFGAIQHIPRIIPGLPEVKAASAAASEAAATANAGKPPEVIKKASIVAGKKAEQSIAANTTKIQEVGGLVGRFLLAALAVVIVSRRKLLRLFVVPGLAVMPLVFAYCAVTGLIPLQIGIFFAGLLTVAQFSFWGNYLPRVYPMHLRGTGESFAANIGGRLIGTSFAWVTTTLATTTDLAAAPAKLAYTAAAVGFGVYLVSLILSFFLPEPKEELLD